MGATDGTSTGNQGWRKKRPFTLDGPIIDRIVEIQDRTNPRLSQLEVIELGIELADRQTRALQPKTKAALLAEIVGVS